MSSKPLTIGQLSRKTGVTARTIRHYERLGLLKAAGRTGANYRLFDVDSITHVTFIARCRSLGFSIPEIADLLQITGNASPTCAQIATLTRS